MLRRTPRLTLFPYTTLFRSMADRLVQAYQMAAGLKQAWFATGVNTKFPNDDSLVDDGSAVDGRSPLTGADVNNVVSVTVSLDRKSTRLNSSHLGISYAVFCL